MKAPRPYRKLAASHKVGVATGGWISLYAAADHLLLCSSSGFMETYARFYFVDIEAITVRRTMRGMVWNAVLAFGLFVSLVTLWETNPPHVVSGIFAGFFAFLLILNVAFGATCVTQLQTRVQTRALPIRRVRKALRVVDRLFKTIEDAQAEIVVAAPVETPVQALAPVSQAPGVSVPPPLPGEKPVNRGSGIRVVAFAWLLLTGATAIGAGLLHRDALRYSACAALLINLPIGIIALVQQRRYALAARPRLIIWISVIAHSLLLPTAYFVFSIMYTMSSTRMDAPPGPLTMQMPLSALGNMPGFDTMLWICGVLCAVLGLLGSFAMLAERGPTEPARAG